MPRKRAPWWMFLIAASVVVTFCFNLWIDFMGPEAAGWSRMGYTLRVKEVAPGGPFERAGVRAGDILLAVDGQRLFWALDWDAIRTNFEIGRPFRLDVQRGQDTLHFNVVLDRRQYQAWASTDSVFTLSIRFAQLILLGLALLIIFKRPFDLSARLAGWLLGSLAAVTFIEYGWAAQLRHLPAPVTALVLAAVVFSNTGPTAWFCFFAMFPRRLLTRPWHWVLALLPAVASVPFSVWVVRWVYFPDEISGVVSLRLFFTMAGLGISQELAGLGILVYNYFHLREANERRRVGVLLLGTTVGWAGAMIVLFAFDTYVVVGGVILFLAFPLCFAYAILRQRLFDVQVIIRQGLQYAAARGVLISLMPVSMAILVLDLALRGDQSLGDIMKQRGWLYAAGMAVVFVAYRKRDQWMEALDKRFFRERYNAQQLLRQTVEEIRSSRSLEEAGPRIVSRVEAALHPEFVALMVREPSQHTFTCLASAPAGIALPGLAADSKLMAAFRLFGKPLQISLSESGWLKQQLPHADTEFLRQARIDLMVPVSLSASSREALLALGQKKSEEPYAAQDEELLLAITNSLALLLERPASVVAGSGLEECPRCGACYDTATGKCALDGSQLTHLSTPRLLASRYRLDRRLGRGGMGAVYSALDASLDRQVALKLIREDLVASPEAGERFRREARVAASFAHPNVVTVFDFGMTEDHRAFLVMELLEGRTLRDELREAKRLTAARTLDIMRCVCLAVDAAHRRQLIHRDLKPENIFLARSETGETSKVLDFGIAKFVPNSTQATADTAGGLLMGTMFYMAPEQLRGQAVEAAWDLWALGVTTYEMLTGAQPFVGPTVAELHSAVLAGRFIPLVAHLPNAPARWQEFFAGALALDPKRRPSSAQAFFSKLERFLA